MGTAALAALAGAVVEVPKLPVNDNVRVPFVMTARSPIKASEALFPRPQRLASPMMQAPHPTCVSARSRRSM